MIFNFVLVSLLQISIWYIVWGLPDARHGNAPRNTKELGLLEPKQPRLQVDKAGAGSEPDYLWCHSKSQELCTCSAFKVRQIDQRYANHHSAYGKRMRMYEVNDDETA